MIAEGVLVIVLSAITGGVSKWSDLFNDDGLPSRWGADPLSGVVWAATGGALVVIDPQVAAVWCATALYWFLRVKLDHFNHAVAGVVILAAGLYAASHGALDLTATIALFVWLSASGYVNTYLKLHRALPRSGLARFLRLRLRYYAGPIVLAIVTGNSLPALSILSGMCATELVTAWGRRRLGTRIEAVAQPLVAEGKAA